ncbi:otopetrin-2-like [Arapaima gigas]
MTVLNEVLPACDLGEKAHHAPRLTLPPSEATTGQKKGNHGSLLSGVICINILILGCALLCSSVFKPAGVSPVTIQILLSVLLLLTTGWMVYYMAYVTHQDKAVLYKDGHAGPVWLRGGLVLFGMCSLVMDAFKIANYVGYTHCDSPVKIIFPAVQALFILIQTYFLWFHAKDCAQVQRNITRCGLMLCLSSNLVVWMMSVTEESLHQTVFPENISLISKDTGLNAFYDNSRTFPISGNKSSGCKCSHTACDIFKKAYYYLYPFNIEYSLFASAMAYVMWKNVGRLVDEHAHHKHCFRLKGIIVGPVVGLAVLVAGLATFVFYEVDMATGSEAKKELALKSHYLMNIIAVALMCLAAVTGYAIYWLDKRDHVSEKNPTRSLDIGLLLGSSLGQLLICYFNIVAIVANGAITILNVFNLTCSLLIIIQHVLQNAFIIEGLHRKPFMEEHGGHVITNPHALHANQETHQPRTSRRSTSIVIITTGMHIPVALGLCWKRRLLKEISIFLLLCNVILWIIPAFGARPQFDNSIGIHFYGLNVWSAVVNIGLPFGIFYRMHSVASLFEVFLTS